MRATWTVDYGQGQMAVEVPHVWAQEVPVTWEGPAVYQTTLDLPNGEPWLVFHGVSYLAELFVNGSLAKSHEGIWDAFAVDLSPWAGSGVEVEVRVTKNGGPRFPVKDVASGFLPYVFHTFGGIFREVELVQGEPNLEPPAPPTPVSMKSGRILVDSVPFFMRGVLTWGWNPATCTPHHSRESLIKEIDKIQELGFNTVKFCLWLPQHEYLVELARRGMWAWLELPIWMPSTDPARLEAMRQECLTIVRQYRQHPNIIAWTAGCELSEGIDPAWRKVLVEDIQKLTGHPLVKDNSGGAEMYGGHPAEFGTFNDFHPYCDSPWYPLVLNQLADGPRAKMPTLFGEFNDYDVIRPVHDWKEIPYWASDDPALNDQGVRWQHDLPTILKNCSETDLGEWLEARWPALHRSSLSQGAWMREKVFDALCSEVSFDGWVITGHRHTPISTSGVIGDQDEFAYPPEVVQNWTSDVRLMLVPRRTPPWVNGGNRPGWEDPFIRFAGPALFQGAVHSVTALRGAPVWKLGGAEIGRGEVQELAPLTPVVVSSIVVDLTAGVHTLTLEFAGHVRTWQVEAFEPLEVQAPTPAPAEALITRPFFREACYSFESGLWRDLGWEDNWSRLQMVASDSALDPAWLNANLPGWRPALVRVDTRTFERLPAVAVRGKEVLTSLRPEGGLGIQPVGIKRNPAGQQLCLLISNLAASIG